MFLECLVEGVVEVIEGVEAVLEVVDLDVEDLVVAEVDLTEDTLQEVVDIVVAIEEEVVGAMLLTEHKKENGLFG
jgi:hypothetical protein